jgi:hypothetical protein
MSLLRTDDHSNAKDQDERLHWYRAPREEKILHRMYAPTRPHYNSFRWRRRSCTMFAKGPEILYFGCPNLTMFSFGFSLSPSPALFLHRNQDPSRDSSRGAGGVGVAVNGGIYRWKAILAVKQVILSPSSVYTSASTV